MGEKEERGEMEGTSINVAKGKKTKTKKTVQYTDQEQVKPRWLLSGQKSRNNGVDFLPPVEGLLHF